MEETPGEKPKLHIDEDWKSQAQAEKERLEREQAMRAKSRTEPEAAPVGSGASQPADSEREEARPAEAKPSEA
ncbi:MAG TPA: hypothetical protein VHY20_08125, partial [Pirellulales bacterium]|nr:hypothetical protein [Pirellulales bacterium]